MYQNRKYSINFGSRLQEFQKSDKYTDFVICTPTQQLKAHRLVLASSSPYWEAMFSGGFAEHGAESVNLVNISCDVLETILQYVYTGKITLQSDTVQSIYIAADFLQYAHIKKCCLNFIDQDIKANTCLSYFWFADKYMLEDLKIKCKTQMVNQFDLVSAKSEFYELPFEVVCNLVCRDDLQYTSEKRTIMDRECRIKLPRPLIPASFLA